MPPLTDHQSGQTTKLLLMGDSGSGKTGALSSLVRAGYRLHIADMDNGLDILANLLRDKPDLLRQVNYQTWTDRFRTAGVNLIPQSATAWSSLVKALNSWPDDLGSIESWDTNIIFVLDSLNFAGKAAMRHIQQLNGRLATPPQIQDFRDAQILVENLCAKLYSDSIRCNVICCTHIRELGKREEVVDDKNRVRTVELLDTVRGFPETGTGRALSPSIGRYFNAVLLADIIGSGAATRRVIRTVPHGNIGLKNSAPGVVAKEYPLDSGLASYFEAVRSPKGAPVKMILAS